MAPQPLPLKAYLALAGRRQRHLAAQVEVSANYLTRVVNGRERPSQRLVQRIAGALGLSVDEVHALLEPVSGPQPIDVAATAARIKEMGNR